MSVKKSSKCLRKCKTYNLTWQRFKKFCLLQFVSGPADFSNPQKLNPEILNIYIQYVLRGDSQSADTTKGTLINAVESLGRVMQLLSGIFVYLCLSFWLYHVDFFLFCPELVFIFQQMSDRSALAILKETLVFFASKFKC